MFNDYYLPIEILKNENFELEEHKLIYTPEEAKNIGIEEKNTRKTNWKR